MSLRLMFHPERAASKLEIVTDNDSYFMTVTINKLDETLDGLTKHAENATYVDENFYENDEGIRLPWYTLSIGSKTVLNAFYNPDVCFSQVECNPVACANLKNLTQGCITPGYLVDLDKDDVCDVIVDDDPSRKYTSVSAIHAGQNLSFSAGGSFSIDLNFGFNVIKDMTFQDKEIITHSIKCYAGAPYVKHIATAVEYRKFLQSRLEDDCENTIIFLDRFSVFGSQEVIDKCRDLKHAVVLVECTGFMDMTNILPRYNVVIEKQGRMFKLRLK